MIPRTSEVFDDLPSEHECVLPGIVWGSPAQLFTPAYWLTQCRLANRDGRQIQYKLGNSLLEEMIACLAGGYGIPSEIGMAAFDRIKASGILFSSHASSERFNRLLSEPLQVNGRPVLYRFARQKAMYFADATRFVNENQAPTDDFEFRNWLLQVKGIGLKTASWITRNWRDSDRVAVIDIHIQRAGQHIGLFKNESPSKNYFEMEQRFLVFADILGARASELDTIMWSHMKNWGRLIN
jgi:N-glycosylase/DNA lyase